MKNISEYDPAKLLVAKLKRTFGKQLWDLALEIAVSEGHLNVSEDDIRHAGQMIFFRCNLSPELKHLL